MNTMERVRDLMGQELRLGDSSLSVGMILIALALLILGYLLSRALSRAMGRVLTARAKIERGQAAAIETLTFYILFVCVALTALRLVNFPLTAFAFVGGALAIGVGFGSQNLLNNFISGLILLIERPVRVGDLVEVEGTYGNIEQIGMRSIRVLASDNTHVIVPNSFFLQNNVLNFTLSDDIMRTQVNVGVVYGSPTRRVEELIRQALRENEKVLPREPIILFADFGDNSLVFEAFFWIRARAIMERRRIESEIRFRIDDLFRAEGLVIAFPQRDVHLDSVKPIDVRVVQKAPSDN